MKQWFRELLVDLGISILVMCGLAVLVLTGFIPIAAFPFQPIYVIILKCLVLLLIFVWIVRSLKR